MSSVKLKDGTILRGLDDEELFDIISSGSGEEIDDIFTPSKARLDSAAALRAQAASDLKDAKGGTYEEQHPYMNFMEQGFKSLLPRTSEIKTDHPVGLKDIKSFTEDLLSFPGRTALSTVYGVVDAASDVVDNGLSTSTIKAAKDAYVNTMQNTPEKRPPEEYGIIGTLEDVVTDPYAPIYLASGGLGSGAKAASLGKYAYPAIQGVIGAAIEGTREASRPGSDVGDIATSAAVGGLANAALPAILGKEVKGIEKKLIEDSPWLGGREGVEETAKKVKSRDLRYLDLIKKLGSYTDYPIMEELPAGHATGKTAAVLDAPNLGDIIYDSMIREGTPGSKSDIRAAVDDIISRIPTSADRSIKFNNLLDVYTQIKSAIPKDIAPSMYSNTSDMKELARKKLTEVFEDIVKGKNVASTSRGVPYILQKTDKLPADMAAKVAETAPRLAEIDKAAVKVAKAADKPSGMARAKVVASTKDIARATERGTKASVFGFNESTRTANRERLKAEAARLYNKLSTNPDTKKLLSSGTTFGHLSRLLADGTNDSLNSYIVELRKVDEGYTKSKGSKN